MYCQSPLDKEIDQLKKKLESTAAKYKYNFHHPKVVEISQKLDILIVRLMAKKLV
jgi:hypothetical protein